MVLALHHWDLGPCENQCQSSPLLVLGNPVVATPLWAHNNACSINACRDPKGDLMCVCHIKSSLLVATFELSPRG